MGILSRWGAGTSIKPRPRGKGGGRKSGQQTASKGAESIAGAFHDNMRALTLNSNSNLEHPSGERCSIGQANAGFSHVSRPLWAGFVNIPILTVGPGWKNQAFVKGKRSITSL